MTDDALREQIHKRMTLNWLIQGASEHAGMTFHHLVRDELNAIEPKLLWLYDRFALLGMLQYWQRDAILLLGWPPRFWRRAASKPVTRFSATRCSPDTGVCWPKRLGNGRSPGAKKRGSEPSRWRSPFKRWFAWVGC